MRRHRTALRGGHVFLAALLALPPCVRVGLHVWNANDRAAREAEELREARGGPESAPVRAAGLHFQDPEGRYLAVLADAIPLCDPSSARSVIWAVFANASSGAIAPPEAALEGSATDEAATGPVVPGPVVPGPVVPDTAAVVRGALLGRVVAVRPELRLARIQTVRDPGFRVRFTARRGTGLLRPAGSDEDGWPLLEPRYISPGCELEVGEPVFTEGNDGVYPPGVLVGRVVPADDPGRLDDPPGLDVSPGLDDPGRAEDPRRSEGSAASGDPARSAGAGRLLVRSALRPEDVFRMALPVDVRKAQALLAEWSHAGGKGRR